MRFELHCKLGTFNIQGTITNQNCPQGKEKYNLTKFEYGKLLLLQVTFSDIKYIDKIRMVYDLCLILYTQTIFIRTNHLRNYSILVLCHKLHPVSMHRVDLELLLVIMQKMELGINNSPVQANLSA